MSVYRVHWLRAKARHDRSWEELILIRHEMTWTIEYFNYQLLRWSHHYEAINTIMQPGHAAYAVRLMQMWLAFADHAKATFQPLLTHDPFVI